MVNQLLALLTDSNLWAAIAAIALPLLAMRGGIAQQIVGALGAQMGTWLKARVPATQYAVIQTVAGDAVRYAFQVAQDNWGSQQKQDAALSYLRPVLATHGIKWDDATLRAMIDLAWAQAKPAVLTDALHTQSTQAAFQTYLAYTAANPLPGTEAAGGHPDLIGEAPSSAVTPSAAATLAVTAAGS